MCGFFEKQSENEFHFLHFICCCNSRQRVIPVYTLDLLSLPLTTLTPTTSTHYQKDIAAPNCYSFFCIPAASTACHSFLQPYPRSTLSGGLTDCLLCAAAGSQHVLRSVARAANSWCRYTCWRQLPSHLQFLGFGNPGRQVWHRVGRQVSALPFRSSLSVCATLFSSSLLVFSATFFFSPWSLFTGCGRWKSLALTPMKRGKNVYTKIHKDKMLKKDSTTHRQAPKHTMWKLFLSPRPSYSLLYTVKLCITTFQSTMN